MKKWGVVLFFCVVLIHVCAAVEIRKGDERYYYQREWGTQKFQIVRSGDKEITLKIAEPGKYSFKDDGGNVEGVDSFQAEWLGVAGSEVILLVSDQRGNIWKSSKPTVEGINKWGLSDFIIYKEGIGGRTKELSPGILFFSWEVSVSTPTQLRLKNCRIVFRDQSVLNYFMDDPKAPPMYFPRATPKEGWKSLDLSEPRVIFAENTSAFDRESWRKLIIQWANQEFPGAFGLDFNKWAYPSLSGTVQELRQNNCFTILESHQATNYTAWVRNHELSLTRYDGFSPDLASWPEKMLGLDVLRYHGVNTAEDAVLEFQKAQMNAVYDLGFDSYLIVDYVWPYFGGRWGYGKSEVKMWKKYLKGEGASVELVNPSETWRFEDYWYSFVSIPLVPGEFGWKNWDEFECATESQASKDTLYAKRLLLFNALWHYHMLAVVNQLGQVAEERGRELGIAVNAEDVLTGDDWSLMARLKYLDSFGYEIFVSPKNLGVWGHTLPYLKYRDKGKGPQLDLVGEINAGGHGPSRYDRDVAYAFYYNATASFLPRHYNNQYMESLWTEPNKLSANQQGRFDHWFAGAHAFLLRHQEEKMQSPIRPEVTVIASRSVIEYQDSTTNTSAQDGNLAPYLRALNIDFEQVGRDIWKASRDTHTKVLVFSPNNSTPAQRIEVKKWIESGDGKTLILHGGAAWKSDRHFDQPKVDAVVWSASASYRDSITQSSGARMDETLFPLPEVKEKVRVSIKGDAVDTKWWDAKIPGKKVLLADDDGTPLISGWNMGKNRVIHLAVDLLARKVSPWGIQLVDKVREYSSIRAFAEYEEGWDLLRWDVPGGSVVTGWKTSVLEEQAKTTKYYCRTKLPVPQEIDFLVEPNKEYVIYSVYSQKTAKQKSSPKGVLKVTFEQAPEMFYYGLDTPIFQKTLENAGRTMRVISNRSRVNVK